MLINRKRDFAILVGVVLIVMLTPIAVGEYYRYLIRLICVYTLLALGLNIFMGFAGQINLGSAGFFCIGAYSATLLVTKLGLNYFAAMPGSNFLDSNYCLGHELSAFTSAWSRHGYRYIGLCHGHIPGGGKDALANRRRKRHCSPTCVFVWTTARKHVLLLFYFGDYRRWFHFLLFSCQFPDWPSLESHTG